MISNVSKYVSKLVKRVAKPVQGALSVLERQTEVLHACVVHSLLILEKKNLTHQCNAPVRRAEGFQVLEVVGMREQGLVRRATRCGDERGNGRGEERGYVVVGDSDITGSKLWLRGVDKAVDEEGREGGREGRHT